MHTVGDPDHVDHLLVCQRQIELVRIGQPEGICGIERLNEVVCNSPNNSGPPQNHHILHRSITILDVKLLSAIAAGDASPGMTAFQTAAS
jgi:hypothetical protein